MPTEARGSPEGSANRPVTRIRLPGAGRSGVGGWGGSRAAGEDREVAGPQFQVGGFVAGHELPARHDDDVAGGEARVTDGLEDPAPLEALTAAGIDLGEAAFEVDRRRHDAGYALEPPLYRAGADVASHPPDGNPRRQDLGAGQCHSSAQEAAGDGQAREAPMRRDQRCM